MFFSPNLKVRFSSIPEISPKLFQPYQYSSGPLSKFAVCARAETAQRRATRRRIPRVPDEEHVWVGHWGQVHRWLSAAEAAALFATADDPLGWEVVMPRRIEATEIQRTRRLPQVIGWRFYPKAKGKPPYCTCKFCTCGEYGRCQAPQAPGLSRRRIVTNGASSPSCRLRAALGLIFWNGRRIFSNAALASA